MKAVLNVGGGAKTIPIPAYYADWRHDLLDIDPRYNPDVLMDARKLRAAAGATYDAVYCSHTLDVFHRRDGAKVIDGFYRVLKPDGFAEVRVPNLQAVIKHAGERGMDLDDVLYQSPAGPIALCDVIYGYRKQLEAGNDFYARRTGYTPHTLRQLFNGRGFVSFVIASHAPFEMTGYFFKTVPSAELWSTLGLPGTPESASM